MVFERTPGRARVSFPHFSSFLALSTMAIHICAVCFGFWQVRRGETVKRDGSTICLRRRTRNAQVAGCNMLPREYFGDFGGR